MFQGTFEKILGIVPRKFPGIGSEDLFARNSQEFPQIFSGFSEELENKKFSAKLLLGEIQPYQNSRFQ